MSAYTDRMNALNRMTQQQRDAEILRQAFGPLFEPMFGGVTDPPEAHQAPPPEAA